MSSDLLQPLQVGRQPFHGGLGILLGESQARTHRSFGRCCSDADALHLFSGAHAAAGLTVPQYDPDIHSQVTDKGPGGHILTGLVAIEEAEPEDVLGNGEVDITALETWLTGTFKFVVHKGPRLLWPRGGNADELYRHGVR